MISARQDAAEVKRVKLDYEEITPCLKEVTRIWESMLNTPDRVNVQFDMHKIHTALKDGKNTLLLLLNSNFVFRCDRAYDLKTLPVPGTF